MKKFLLGLIIGLSFLASSAYALSTFQVIQGGTGATTLTGCLTGNGTSPITGSGSPCGSGSGGGGGSWATSTVSGWPTILNNYSLNTTDVVEVGGTSTSSAKYYFDPNNQMAQIGVNANASTTLYGNIYTRSIAQGFAGIGTNGLLYNIASSSINLSNLNNDLANLTATNASLTFSGAYNGSTARTVGINLGNTNTWTVLQNFNYSSSTIYSSFVTASTTNLVINGSSFNNLLGTGLSNVSGTLTNSGVTSITATSPITRDSATGVVTIACATCNTSNATVSSVGLSLPAFFTITNSPVTTTGTLTGAINFAKNSVITSDSAGTNLIATGTQLTVGNLLATTTTGWSIFLNDGVGIGTSSPSSPFLLNLSSSTVPQLSLGAGAGVAQWTFRNAGGSFYLSTTTVQGTATSSTAQFAINGSTGNVGIGSSSPMSKLSVVGNEDHWGNYYHFGPSIITDGYYCLPNSQCLAYYGNDNTTLGVNVQVGNVTKGLHAYAGFNVQNDLTDNTGTHYSGIYLTSSAYNDNAFGTALNTINQFQILNGDGPIAINPSTTTSASYIQLLTGGSILGSANIGGNERLRIDPVGRVGIGTTTPQWLLNLATTTRPQLALQGTSNDSVFTMRSIGSQFYIATASPTTFATTSISALSIDGNSGTTTLRGLDIQAQATSTSNVGFNLSAGCYAIAGACIGSGGAGSGTVTSVGLSLPASFTVTNSPVTSAGTLTAALNFPPNSILTSNAAGTDFLATTSQLTVGSLISTTTSSSFFLGGLGIGTSTLPSLTAFSSNVARLLVASTTGSQIALQGGVIDNIWKFRSIGSNFYIATSASNSLSTTTGAGGALTILGSNGSIGINDNTPDYQLETTGSATNGYFGITQTTDGDLFNISSFGAIGIGTTTPHSITSMDIASNTPQISIIDNNAVDGGKLWNLGNYDGLFAISSSTGLLPNATTSAFSIGAPTIGGSQWLFGTTTSPYKGMHISNGASATTTVTIGELGLTTSKSCVNMNDNTGNAASFYIRAGVMVVEANYCRP